MFAKKIATYSWPRSSEYDMLKLDWLNHIIPTNKWKTDFLSKTKNWFIVAKVGLKDIHPGNV